MPRDKADVFRRIVAYLIDIVIAMTLALITAALMPPLAPLASALYLLFKDGLMFAVTKQDAWKNRSPGKRLLNLEIVSESGVAAGVRRIEALTGESARRWLIDQAAVAKNLADQFKVPVVEVVARVEALEAQRRKLEKELADAKRQLAMGGGGGGATGPEEIGGVQVIARVMEQLHPGSNILMHELPWTVEALDRLLEQIREQGYRFVDPHAIRTEPEASIPSR